MSKFVQDLYDSFPEEESFDPNQLVDAFLVGEGSVESLKINQNRSNSDQLVGIFSVKDLKNKSAEESVCKCEDDLSDFAVLSELVDDCESYFFKIKKEIFEQYDYLAVKSRQYQGKLVRERDLVLNSDDSYLLHYIKEKGYHYENVISSLAKLSAYQEMGFDQVQFVSVDKCILCEAYEGLVYRISDLISRIGSGNLFIHEGVVCGFIPLIKKRPKDFFLLNAFIEQVKFENLPREFEEHLSDELLESLKGCTVIFTELEEEGITVKREENVFYVRNSFLYYFSPLDFLKSWFVLDNLKEVESVDITQLKDRDIFYLDGKKVVEFNGKYINIETGKVLDNLGG